MTTERMHNKKTKTSTHTSEPHVGIFWLVHGRLVIDATLLSAAEDYGDFKIHPRDHYSVWEAFKLSGTVLPEVPYEEFPRGRVMFNEKTGQFNLLADRCILRRRQIVVKIKKALHLPRDTSARTDSHYRCLKCLRESDELE